MVVVTTMCFAGLGGLALWAARREPGAGHGYIGAALISIPALAMVLAITRSPAVAVRYWGFMPLLVLGLTLLTVSLLRRRRQLEDEVARRARAEQALTELNASLEAKVSRRTQDLHAMVAALESFNRNVSHDLRGPLGGIGARPPERTGTARGQRHPWSGTARTDRPPGLLRAAFTNLIGNAMKFTAGREDGHVQISAEQDEANVTVIVIVQDNGIGFDDKLAARLFQPFVRLHGRHYEGHGIGLSIVRRAVERHGGAVRAIGRPGEGATFTITLPRVCAGATAELTTR